QDDWLLCCTEAGVLEIRDERSRFAHDKLCEQLLEDLGPTLRHEIHRRVAEAIEAEYPGHAEYCTALAHHWQQAAEPGKEGEYAQHGGILALQSGACQEAVVHLSRALEVMRGSPEASERTARTSLAGRRPTRERWSALLDPTASVNPDSEAFRLGMVES